MTDTRANYDIPSWRRERTSRKFDQCAIRGGLIVPGMKYERRLFRFGEGKPNSSVLFEGPFSWDKVHLDCGLSWYQVEHNPITKPLNHLRASTAALARREARTMGTFCIQSNGSKEVTWVPGVVVQKVLQKNEPSDVEAATIASGAAFELLAAKITEAILSPRKAARLGHVLTDLAAV